MSQVSDRFAAAVRALVGDGSVKERLGRAFLEHLAPIEDNDLPPAQRQAFSELRLALTKVTPFGKEGTVRATVQKMSPAEAERHARIIVQLYGDLTVADRAEPLKVVAGKREPPPKFLAARP